MRFAGSCAALPIARAASSAGGVASASRPLLATLGIGLYFRRYEGGAPNLFFVWSADAADRRGDRLCDRPRRSSPPFSSRP